MRRQTTSSQVGAKSAFCGEPGPFFLVAARFDGAKSLWRESGVPSHILSVGKQPTQPDFKLWFEHTHKGEKFHRSLLSEIAACSRMQTAKIAKRKLRIFQTELCFRASQMFSFQLCRLQGCQGSVPRALKKFFPLRLSRFFGDEQRSNGQHSIQRRITDRCLFFF